MRDVRILNFIPAEDPVSLSRGVNLLLMIDNRGDETTACIRFFASDGTQWRELIAEERNLPGKTHVHAYFRLPPECFAPSKWGGESQEELTVCVGEAPPENGERGQLLFFVP